MGEEGWRARNGERRGEGIGWLSFISRQSSTNENLKPDWLHLPLKVILPHHRHLPRSYRERNSDSLSCSEFDSSEGRQLLQRPWHISHWLHIHLHHLLPFHPSCIAHHRCYLCRCVVLVGFLCVVLCVLCLWLYVVCCVLCCMLCVVCVACVVRCCMHLVVLSIVL